jgi:hypothetical protein
VTTYQQAHPLYRRLGWTGVLPLAHGAKWPPPTGFTGWDGVDPSGADCTDFDELPVYRDTAQTALRMPPTVVGLDVDAYGDKTGVATLAEAESRWGPLPAGPWSTARGDGVSGIRFYRVPDGTVLVGDLAFLELRIGHVEVIQRHHRYAAVWPSLHPATGAPYTWHGTAAPEQPPAVADLPALPETWLAGLAGTGHRGERACPEQVTAFLATLPAGTACEGVRAALRDADAALRAPVRNRHDDTCTAVLRLLRLGERGHPGVTAALDALRVVFVRAVTADGSRTTAAAEAEFDRMRQGDRGVGLIRSTPTPPERRGCRCAAESRPPTRESIAGLLRKVLAATGDDRAQLVQWATRRLRGHAAAGRLDRDYAHTLVEQLHAAAGGPRR